MAWELMGTVMMRKTAGFTLIELLIGLVVLAILLTTAIPAFRAFIQNNRLDSEANDLVAATQLARSEALKRGVNVTICSSNNGTSCGGGFRDGWIVIEDPAVPASLVQSWPSPGPDFQFTPAGVRVDFAPSGFLLGAAAVNLDMVLSECSNDNARQIQIERTGRVASRRVACP